MLVYGLGIDVNEWPKIGHKLRFMPKSKCGGGRADRTERTELSDQSVSQACEYFSIQGIGKQHKNKTKPRISLDTKTQRKTTRTKKGKKLCIFIITRQRDDHHQTNYHHQCRKSAAINELLTVLFDWINNPMPPQTNCPALENMMEYYLHRTPFSWPIDCVHRNRLVQWNPCRHPANRHVRWPNPLPVCWDSKSVW